VFREKKSHRRRCKISILPLVRICGGFLPKLRSALYETSIYATYVLDKINIAGVCWRLSEIRRGNLNSGKTVHDIVLPLVSLFEYMQDGIKGGRTDGQTDRQTDTRPKQVRFLQDAAIVTQ